MNTNPQSELPEIRNSNGTQMSKSDLIIVPVKGQWHPCWEHRRVGYRFIGSTPDWAQNQSQKSQKKHLNAKALWAIDSFRTIGHSNKKRSNKKHSARVNRRTINWSRANSRHGLVNRLDAVAHGELIDDVLGSLVEVDFPGVVALDLRKVHHAAVAFAQRVEQVLVQTRVLHVVRRHLQPKNIETIIKSVA